MGCACGGTRAERQADRPVCVHCIRRTNQKLLVRVLISRDAKCVSHLQFLGMIQWALIASTPDMYRAAYGWVMFVTVTLWILTILLFFLILFSIHRHAYFISWTLMVGERQVFALLLVFFRLDTPYLLFYFFIFIPL